MLVADSKVVKSTGTMKQNRTCFSQCENVIGDMIT